MHNIVFISFYCNNNNNNNKMLWLLNSQEPELRCTTSQSRLLKHDLMTRDAQFITRARDRRKLRVEVQFRKKKYFNMRCILRLHSSRPLGPTTRYERVAVVFLSTPDGWSADSSGIWRRHNRLSFMKTAALRNADFGLFICDRRVIYRSGLPRDVV